MNLAPINDIWSRQTFPNIYRLCEACESSLSEQIECFNKIITARNISLVDNDLISDLMKKEEIRNPHFSLLGTLSALHILGLDNRQVGKLSGQLFLLEQSLKTLSEQWTPNQFKSLIRSPQSLTNLVAEIDWAARLRTTSDNLKLHNKKAANSEKNYDLRWTNQGITIHADVKWYEAWFTKGDGSDILKDFLRLLPTEIKEPIEIVTSGEIITEDQAIEEVERIHEMYRIAMNEENTTEYYIQRCDNMINVVNQSQAARFIVEISIYTDSCSRPRAIIVERGYDTERDKGTIYRNLLGAAQQIPDHGSTDNINVILLGSFDPYDFGLVEDELSKENGLFKDTSFKNIEGVIFFSFSFHHLSQESLIVGRTCEIFERPGLCSRKKKALEALKDSYQSTHIPFKRPNS